MCEHRDDVLLDRPWFMEGTDERRHGVPVDGCLAGVIEHVWACVVRPGLVPSVGIREYGFAVIAKRLARTAHHDMSTRMVEDAKESVFGVLKLENVLIRGFVIHLLTRRTRRDYETI